MKSQIKFVIYGIIVIAVLGLVYSISTNYYTQQKINVQNPDETNLKEVSCDITVENPLGFPLVKNGDLNIISANCEQQYVNNCGRFGFFSDKGGLRLDGKGGLGSATDINVNEHSSKSYTLTWCGSKLTKSFDIKLFNDNNENIQTKNVILT